MSLHENKLCAACGGKANILTRTKLKDKTVLCRKCASKVPSYIRKTLKNRYALQDYKNLMRYVDYSRKELNPLFHSTYNYYAIQLDEEHGLFSLGRKINEKSVIFRLDKVIGFDLAFKGESYKESLVDNYVNGKIVMGLEMEEPYFYHEEILSSYAKAPAKKIMMGTKVSYGDPRGMREFLEMFLRACEACRMAAANREEITEYSPFANNITGDLQQAMALFMIDHFEDITVERIRKQRNRLIKAFHPDVGQVENDAYAQKINNAYELLLQYAK